MHVTIVDDMENILEVYQDLLASDFDLELIKNPYELLPFLKNNKTDLILLDIHMPEISGFDLYNKFKDEFSDIPVIFLTGDPSEETTIKGLSLGAEDFIVKPVSLQELVARIKNKIARKKFSNQKIIKVLNFSLHCEMQLAEVDGKKIQLTPIEFKLIHLFVKHQNQIFSRKYITNLLWPNVHVQNQNIDTHLSNLRKKLHPFSENIKTIKSRGYILRT